MIDSCPTEYSSLQGPITRSNLLSLQCCRCWSMHNINNVSPSLEQRIYRVNSLMDRVTPVESRRNGTAGVRTLVHAAVHSLNYGVSLILNYPAPALSSTTVCFCTSRLLTADPIRRDLNNLSAQPAVADKSRRKGRALDNPNPYLRLFIAGILRNSDREPLILASGIIECEIPKGGS